MTVYQIISEEYQSYFNIPLTPAEAFEISRTLPADFTDIILNNDLEAFRNKFKAYIPFVGMDEATILKSNRTVLGKIIDKQLLSRGMSYKDLARKIGVSASTIYYFVASSESISFVHVQKILNYFGLALDVTTFDLLAEKYLTVVDSEEPTGENLEGPFPPFTSPEDEEPPATEPECTDCDSDENKSDGQQDVNTDLPGGEDNGEKGNVPEQELPKETTPETENQEPETNEPSEGDTNETNPESPEQEPTPDTSDDGETVGQETVGQ